MRRTRWNRAPKKRGTSNPRKLEAQARRQESQRLKAKRRRAEDFGCEYGDWLRAQRGELGCPLCGKRHGGRTVLHHTKRRSQLGVAEDLIFLSQDCHDRGHDQGFEALEARAGVNLAEMAATMAGLGYELGLLPVEPCAVCGDWHSRRYMVDILQEGELTSRACVKCAPAGLPPESSTYVSVRRGE